MDEWMEVADALPEPKAQRVTIRVRLTRADGRVTVYTRSAVWMEHDEHAWMFAGNDEHAIECTPAYRVVAWKPEALHE